MQGDQENSEIIFRRVEHNSEEYKKIGELRQRILMDPIGLVNTQERYDSESDCIHVGGYNSDGGLAACCLLVPDLGEKKLRIRQVAVDDNCRFLGYGKKMMEEVIIIGKEMGLGIAHCNARDTARAFYEKCGFAVEGDSFDKVGIRHWYMWKAIE